MVTGVERDQHDLSRVMVDGLDDRHLPDSFWQTEAIRRMDSPGRKDGGLSDDRSVVVGSCPIGQLIGDQG